jgi:hypothetical protein
MPAQYSRYVYLRVREWVEWAHDDCPFERPWFFGQVVRREYDQAFVILDESSL